MPLNITPSFESESYYTPKDQIRLELKSLENIRLLQLLNWVYVRNKLLSKFSMISSIKLQLADFPNIKAHMTEKKPWVIILGGTIDQYVYSHDGTLLNQNMPDVAFPNQPLLILRIDEANINREKLTDPYVSIIQTIEEQLLKIPLFKLQQIRLNKQEITIEMENGVLVKVGDIKNIEEKLVMLKYFLSYYRGKILSTEYIDIRYPKRVIIKSIQS